jgi:Zn-dependent M28 family amino/carboxypeptidase
VPTSLAAAFGGVGVVSLVTLATLRNGNDSPGGVDNAGSVGILVELAHELPGRIPEEVELVFLSPGAEEDHMVGAMRWLDRHEKELEGRQVWALNIDGAGIPGRVTLLERYGLGKWFTPELSAVARSAASRLGIPVRGMIIPPAMGVDAIPFAHRGIPCLTLTSGSLGRASMSVHSRNDRVENLDGPALSRVHALVGEIVQALAV